MLRWKLLQALESQEAEPSLAPLHLTSLMELWLHLSVTCLLVAQLGNGAKVHLLVVHEGTTGRSPYPPQTRLGTTRDSPVLVPATKIWPTPLAGREQRPTTGGVCPSLH